jgi:four helix bundle protein
MTNEKVKKDELKYRMYTWTLSLIKIIDTIPHTTTNNIIARQIMRSGTSICANYVEGQAASSRKDFINYLHISLKSANETKYWLAILRDLKKADTKKVENNLSELQEIANILAASLITLKKK